jgi:predicted ATPase
MSLKIVLTGGPGAGKTVICARLASQMPQPIVCVPEAASRVYSILGTRWDRLNLEARRDVQRQIYQMQIELEAEAIQGNPGSDQLLDRGTMDGAAYWPKGSDDYWRAVGTTQAAELARYDAVIWLESCAAIGAYDGNTSNPCRFEDAEEAIATGAKLAEVWAGHRGFMRVGARETVDEKAVEVLEIVREIVRLNEPIR